MVGWHHWFNEREFGQTLGYSEGQEGRPGMLQFMSLQSQTQHSDWTTTLVLSGFCLLTWSPSSSPPELNSPFPWSFSYDAVNAYSTSFVPRVLESAQLPHWAVRSLVLPLSAGLCPSPHLALQPQPLSQVDFIQFGGVCVHVCMCAQLHATLCGSMAYNPPAPLSMEFSKQEYWSGLPFPTPGIFPT